MTPELLQELLEECGLNYIPSQDCAKELYNKLKVIQEAEKQRRIIETLKYDEKLRYENEMDKLDKELMELQNKCPHYKALVKYYGDPSGGRDSFHECTLCGKQW